MPTCSSPTAPPGATNVPSGNIRLRTVSGIPADGGSAPSPHPHCCGTASRPRGRTARPGNSRMTWLPATATAPADTRTQRCFLRRQSPPRRCRTPAPVWRLCGTCRRPCPERSSPIPRPQSAARQSAVPTSQPAVRAGSSVHTPGGAAQTASAVDTRIDRH